MGDQAGKPSVLVPSVESGPAPMNPVGFAFVRQAVIAVLLGLLPGCEVHHYDDPSLLGQVIRLQGEVSRLQGQVVSLNESNRTLTTVLIVVFIAVAAAVVIAVLYVQPQRRLRPLRQIETVRTIEVPKVIVLVDRKTGQARELPFDELPAPARRKLLAYTREDA